MEPAHLIKNLPAQCQEILLLHPLEAGFRNQERKLPFQLLLEFPVKPDGRADPRAMTAVNFNIALVFERGIGLVDRHRIDTDVLCKLADGGKAFPQFELSAADAEHDLAIPVVKGRKTDKEKFAGAQATYTIEALMHDGKALQSGTSHYFGDGFARAFGIQFTGRDNTLQYPHQTSWGMSSRIIGAIIMTHGDNNGLVLPPAVAPIQVVILPIAMHKEGVLDKAMELKDRLAKTFRVKVDDSDNSAGWKFAEYEMKGVPLRLEIGPKDIANNQCVLVRRDNREKTFVSLDHLEQAIEEQLEAVRRGIHEKALTRREEMTYSAKTLEELIDIAEHKPGFIRAMWCGDLACEEQLKEKAGVTSRCIPFEQEQIADTCVCCGKPARQMLYWGKAY